MTQNLIEIPKFPLNGNDPVLDLDEIAAKAERLSRQVDSYRETIVRHIKARCELLGKSFAKGIAEKDIPGLLEIKEELDEEFRMRFRLSSEMPVQAVTDSFCAGRYLSGRG